MKIFKNHIPCEDPINFLNFERFEDLIPDNIEFYYGGHPNPKIFEQSNKRKIFFSTEEQIWSRDTTDSCIEQVEKILTICPPELTHRAKRELCFFPYPEEYIQEETEKKFDVIYTGNIDRNLSDSIDVIKKFNYCLVSFGHDSRINYPGVSYLDKLKLISRSKIIICHSLTGDYTETNPSVQVKTRYFEGSLNKSLILYKRDSVNIIDRFFEPNKEFLYYNNKEDLEDLINKILSNYKNYLPIVEAAYNKAINNYTTRHFIQKYLSE